MKNRVFLIFGEEDFLKIQKKKQLITQYGVEGDTMNCSYYEGSNTNFKEIVELAQTLPFFAEHRVIIVENTGIFKKSNELDKVFETIPESSHIIFVESEIDKRNKLYKWVQKNGTMLEMKKQSVSELVKWLKKGCTGMGASIDDEAVNYLVESTGTDMMTLKNELIKLVSYKKTNITIEDVREVCVDQAQNKIFDMLDAIMQQDTVKGLSLYQDLILLKEQPMRILAMLTRHVNILLQIRCIKDQSQVASLVGIPPFTIKKYKSQAQVYSTEKLYQMLEKCIYVDEGIKTGKLNGQAWLEILIVEFSKKK